MMLVLFLNQQWSCITRDNLTSGVTLVSWWRSFILFYFMLWLYEDIFY